MGPNLDKTLNKYLKEIEAGLQEVPSAAKKEFIAEIRSHLLEKWESGNVQNEESLHQVISEFGDPREIAEDYLAKSCIEVKPKGAYPPSWLVMLLTAFIWPVGIILAWISPAWKLRDKIIATLIPPFGLLLLLMLLLPAYVLYSYRYETNVQKISEESVIIAPYENGRTINPEVIE